MWVETDFWLGMPIKGIKVNPGILDQAGLLFSFYSNPKEYALPLTMLFEKAGLIPEPSRLVGVRHAENSLNIIFIFANETFATVEPGMIYPIEEVEVDQAKWVAAVQEMRRANYSIEEALRKGIDPTLRVTR